MLHHLRRGFFPRQGQFILQKQKTSSGSDNHKKESHTDRCGARNRGHFISIWIAPSKWKYVLICKTNKVCEVQIWLERFDFTSLKNIFFSLTLCTQLRFAWRGSLNEMVESCHSIHESINVFPFLFEPLQKLLWISLKEDGKKPKGVVQPPISPFNQSIVTIHEALFENLCCQRSWVCALTGQRHEVDLHNIRQGAHQHVQMRTELLAPLWKFNFKFHKKYFPSVVKQRWNFCYSFPQILVLFWMLT